MLGSFRSNVTVGIAVLVGIAGLSYVLAASAAPPGGTTAAVEFTADGKLKQPVGYRKWVYVGEVVTPNDLNDGEATFPEFHSVYMDPESFAEYEKTGKYRDGTVLIKELSSVGSKKAPSGNGYFQGEFTGLEATIKDSKRFKDEPGNWAYFSFGHKYPLKAEVAKNAASRVQPVPPGQRQEGLGLQPVLPRLACSGPAFEVRPAGGVWVGHGPDTPTSPIPRKPRHERSHEARREMTSTADGPPGSPRRPRNLGRILPRARHPRVWARNPPPDAIGRRHETRFSPSSNLISRKRGGSTMPGSSRTSMTTMVTVLVGIAGLIFILARAGAPIAGAEPAARGAVVEFTPDGKLKQPVGYRQWIYVGASVTPNDLNGGKALFPEFHAIYIDPESFAEYKETGKFRDGTVLVKELSSVGSKETTSGKGYFLGDFTGLAVSIKDSKRFKDEPGNWAYFSFGHKYPLEAEVSKSPTFACNKCHQDSAKQDWVFTQNYNVLPAAAPRSK